jgi:hypothetical protein
MLIRIILSTVNSACNGMNNAPPPRTFYILSSQFRPYRRAVQVLA